MIKTGLHGYGYWGKIIHNKLSNCIINPTTFDLDWVFVATPPQYHYEYVKKYLTNRVNVFCEKPLTDTYDKAVELIELANDKCVNLYVDNIFLLRNEIKSNTYIPKNNITFKWFKNGPTKDSIINDLLYHDIYLLIHFAGIGEISNLNIHENNLLYFKASFNYNNLVIDIDYNRMYSKEKHKSISLDNNVIDLSIPQNDPLQESINACFTNKINYLDNHETSLNTLKLLKNFYD